MVVNPNGSANVSRVWLFVAGGQSAPCWSRGNSFQNGFLMRHISAGRGVRCVDSASRAQIADGVRGRRADASESTRRAVCAAPCLSPHVSCLAGVLAFCRGGAGPCSPVASLLTILQGDRLVREREQDLGSADDLLVEEMP